MKKTTHEKLMLIIRVLRVITLISVIVYGVIAAVSIFRILATIVEGISTEPYMSINGAMISKAGYCVYLVAAIVFAAANILCTLLAKNFLDIALARGTVFTKYGSNALKQYGIVSLAVSIVCSVISSIVKGIGGAAPDVTISIVSAFGMIAISLLLRHGAELFEKPAEPMPDIPVIPLSPEE